MITRLIFLLLKCFSLTTIWFKKISVMHVSIEAEVGENRLVHVHGASSTFEIISFLRFRICLIAPSMKKRR